MNAGETLKGLVRHVITETRRGNLEILRDHPGMAETMPMMRQLSEGFSEATVTFVLQVSEGEWVASRVIERRKHTGTFMDAAPTGKVIETEVLLFHRIVDGKIVQQHSQADVVAAWQQMGILPGAQ